MQLQNSNEKREEYDLVWLTFVNIKELVVLLCATSTSQIFLPYSPLRQWSVVPLLLITNNTIKKTHISCLFPSLFGVSCLLFLFVQHTEWVSHPFSLAPTDLVALLHHCRQKMLFIIIFFYRGDAACANVLDGTSEMMKWWSLQMAALNRHNHKHDETCRH